MLLVALKAHPVRFVVKQEIMRTPVLGRALLHSGNVCVVRTDTAGDTGRIGNEMQRRRPDVSILFYAEGTRARDGAFHPFKKGAFMMAMDAGVPVVPVSISGATRIMAKAQMKIYPETVHITLHDPIPTKGLSKEDLGELMKTARDKIASALTPEEGPAPDGQPRRRAN